MGSPTSEACRDNDEQLHQVTLTHDFEIQSTEVTQGQFSSVMGYNPSYFGPNGRGADCGPMCPVEMVSWHESAAYCNALSQRAGGAACYACSGSGPSTVCQEASAYSGSQVHTCPGYRLPTEAEWELAYRASTQTAYHSGDNDATKCTTCSSIDIKADAIAWYCGNAAGTRPVGQKQPNAHGLYDMAGNIREWCHDWYQTDLGSSPVMDPWGSSAGSFRVLRGGSWYGDASALRAANRMYNAPTHQGRSFGFRCCRTIAP